MYNLVLRYSIASAISVLIAAITIFAYNWQQRIAGLAVDIGLPNKVLLESFIGTLNPDVKRFVIDFDRIDPTTAESMALSRALDAHFQRLLPPPQSPLVKVTLISPQGRIIYSTHPNETGSMIVMTVLQRAAVEQGHPRERIVETDGFEGRAGRLGKVKILADHQPMFETFVHPIADPRPLQPHREQPIAVFSTYSDLTPAIARIQLNSLELMGLSSGVFIAVYAVLLIFVIHAQRIMRRQYDLLARQSTTDGLTGIANRRRFDDALRQEWARATRAQKPLSLIMIDVDHFKAYNDHYGHMQGDERLKSVAQVIEGTLVRAADMAARYGGEEFACILPETNAEGACIMAEKIRAAIEAHGLPHDGNGGHITVSVGHATQTPRQDQTSDDLIEATDEALYRAKKAGRNCVNGIV